MRQYLFRILVGANLAMLALLIWIWVDQEGHVRDVRWQRPGPVRPDISGLQIKPPVRASEADRQFVATLDRPLFSPTRRPPPPPMAAAPSAPVDPLADIQLLGLYGNGEFGGILVRSGGKMKRIQRNQNLGEWTVSEIKGRAVTLTRNGESRVLPLVAARQPGPPVAAVPGAGGAVAGAAGALGSSGPLPDDAPIAQRIEERKRNHERAFAAALEAQQRATKAR